MKNVLVKFFCALIRFYQIAISPLFPSCCRFFPTCSCYAMQAFKKYGPLKGMIMSSARILRCNKFAKGGYDPLPDEIRTVRGAQEK